MLPISFDLSLALWNFIIDNVAAIVYILTGSIELIKIVLHLKSQLDQFRRRLRATFEMARVAALNALLILLDCLLVTSHNLSWRRYS